MCGSVRMSNECVKTGDPNKRTDTEVYCKGTNCVRYVLCVDGESARARERGCSQVGCMRESVLTSKTKLKTVSRRGRECGK